MAQLPEIAIDPKELTKDGKVFVTPTFDLVTAVTTGARQTPEHKVFSACGDGEKAFRVVTYGGVPTKEELSKQANDGLVEIDLTNQNPTLIDFNYRENGEFKNQMASRVDNIAIKK